MNESCIEMSDRSKKYRKNLNGYCCEQCKKFYSMLEGEKISPGEFSRHRHAESPPKTPPGFWNLTFDDEPPRHFSFDK
jgi:hypothetical protein